jgi:hypothetical protein
MTLKEYFKQKLLEDIGSPELMANIEKSYEDKGKDPSNILDRVARSPYLYVPHPDNPNKPMRVPGARLHPRLTYALSSAAEFGRGIPEADVEIIKDFIRQHGHFVGADNYADFAYPEKFRTDDPESVLSNIFGSTRRRK